MGAVYIAEQASTGQVRALKLMHPQLVADPRQRERFEQEARVGARITSDHVVQVIGAGIDRDSGVPWMAMELLEGEDLSTYIDRVGSLPPAEVFDIFRQLCHALGAAHAAGIVHRDVKPENIFLAKTRSVSGPVSVKVLDFGIAKVIAEAKATATAALGTPLWMAPEQTDPRAPVTPASDVWSLGLIAFTALTGCVYWRTASDPHAAMTALMREILFEPLERASVRAAELGRGGLIPGGFDGWFARCVQREASQRFASATEAFEALGPALSGRAEGAAAGAPFLGSAEWANAPTSLATGSGPVPSMVRGSVSGPGTFAQMPTDAYRTAMHRSATGAPVMNTPMSPVAGAQSNAPGGYANLMGMAPTAASPGVEPRRPKGKGAVIGVLVAVAVAAIGGAALVVARQGGDEGSEVAVSQRETGATSQPPSEAARGPVAGGSTAGSVAGTTGAAVSTGPRVAGSPVSAGGTVKPAAAGGAATAAATAQPTAAAAARPFDHAAAGSAVQRAGANARVHCKGKEGPKAVSATVFFNPNGAVQRVSTDPMIASKPSALCVTMMLGSARVPPFDGTAVQPYPTTVGIE